MAVAYRHCKRIGGIVGFGDFIEMQKKLRHLLHLILFRSAVADDTLLDLQGCVFVNGDAPLMHRKNYYAPRLSNVYCRFLVCVEIKAFNAYGIGLEAVKQFADAVVNLDKAVIKVHIFIGGNCAVAQKREIAALVTDNAAADYCITRVYSEDYHAHAAFQIRIIKVILL